jgi:3-oxoacyl-[acyl-carrier-protein] synthase II
MPIDVIVADYGVRTPAGPDIGSTWNRIMAGHCAIAGNSRLSGRMRSVAWPSAVCEGVGYSDSSSMVEQMLAAPLDSLKGRIPPGALLLLATTVGGIDLLENAVLGGGDAGGAGRLDDMLGAVSRSLGLSRRGSLVSCACASSSMAMALGATLIRSGRETDVVVIGCDAVSEFVVAGFAALAALSPEPARPFDRLRQGLSLGEGAGWCWLRGAPPGPAPEGARGRLLGWSCRADAYHMTAPDPQGEGLAAATAASLAMAGVAPAAVGGVCAHGTGTRYNDDMEAKAFARVFAPSAPGPVFSIKGHIGHTLGAAGVIEAAVALEASREGRVPPTTGCREPDPAGTPVTLGAAAPAGSVMLSTNSGFGGVNTALVLDASVSAPRADAPTRGTAAARTALVGLAWATASGLGVATAGGAVERALPPMDNPDAFFTGGYRNWGRVAPQARRLACALEAGFAELRLDGQARRRAGWGIFGMNTAGCHAENTAFFRDYVENGRSLARGGLFVHTLPSTPVAEASIHFGLRGPVCHFVDPALDFSRLVDWACATMAEEGVAGMVVVSIEDDLALCAFLRAAGVDGSGAGMGWADAVVAAIPGAAPRGWLARFGKAAPEN